MKHIVFCMVLCLIFVQAGAQSLRVASYNIRNANSQDAEAGNGWESRCPVIADMILFHNFDIFGAQEVLHSQLEDLLESLPGYGFTGVGRDDGKTEGEYSPIFFKTKRFKLIESGHFWLGEDTEHPVKGWDAACVRICTYGHFLDRESHKRFWFFSLHTDHKGKTAQEESSKLLLRKIEEICDGDRVILTGDFNVGETSMAYRILNESGMLHDTYGLAPIRLETTGTENRFDPGIRTFRKIDHIFVSPDFKVLRYGILTDTYRSGADGKFQARTPSDHFPVVAELVYDR